MAHSGSEFQPMIEKGKYVPGYPDYTQAAQAAAERIATRATQRGMPTATIVDDDHLEITVLSDDDRVFQRLEKALKDSRQFRSVRIGRYRGKKVIQIELNRPRGRRR
jgi:hypothetical protein